MSKMKPKQTLKPKGIRFSDETTANVERDVKKDKTGRLTFSDVVRQIVDEHYSKKKPQ